ncbi:MAG: RluA family pseudouridine synthase, partial [Planctomycetes bacterium]|nr:RluA family pseudouridine synthase [Planctomycetota bacterium]
MTERLEVDAPAPLFAFLAERLAGWSRNTIRQRLDLGCVRVNGEQVTRRDHGLCKGDDVTVVGRDAGEPAPPGTRGFPTLFVDDELVAIDKPAGLLSVSTGRANERTALALLRSALERPGRPAPLWPVHRLDRETSGVLLFARTPEARAAVQAAWREAEKIYLAIVEGRPEPGEGVVEAPLWEDKG